MNAILLFLFIIIIIYYYLLILWQNLYPLYLLTVSQNTFSNVFLWL